MQFEFSRMGGKLAGPSGILTLMDDLGRALASDPHMLMLGGGNPALIPEMTQIWRERIEVLLKTGTMDRLLGQYDPPQGNLQVIESLAKLLRTHYGWNVSTENIAVTSGGQTAFFYLFNLLAGQMSDGSYRRILLPVTPEYIGYSPLGLDSGLFVGCRPKISTPDESQPHLFKYHVDLEAVESALSRHSIGAIAISRPTNPSGNFLSDEETREIVELATRHRVPVIIDNAYGAPFPGVVFQPTTPVWNESMITTFSLSKLGLPGTRTAFVVAAPQIIKAITAMSAVTGLSHGTVGQQLVADLIESGQIVDLGPKVLRPFYEEKSRFAVQCLTDALKRHAVDGRIHVSEGAFFLWLWLPGLPISSQKLYERLKLRKVLIVPGEEFFFGLEEPWKHAEQCIRLNFAQPAHVLEKAFEVIASEVSLVCRG